MTDTTIDVETKDTSVPPSVSREEANDVTKWMDTIEATQKFDDEARKQYARDRRYARGDSGFAIDDNLIGTYIDIVCSFLYARNPDVAVVPAPATEPPSAHALQLAAEVSVDQDPDAQMAGQMAARGVLQDTGNELSAAEAGQAAAHAMRDQKIKEKAKELRDTYNRQQELTQAFGSTLEIVISRAWRDGRLKKRGKKWARSALTVGVGLMKAFWLERTAPSPETTNATSDALAQLRQLQQMQMEFADDTALDDRDAKMAEAKQRLQALQSTPDEVQARGFVIEYVRPENFLWTPGYDLSDCDEAPWNAQLIPMLVGEAVAEFKLSQADVKQATVYVARKPEGIKDQTPGIGAKIDPKDANAFVQTGDAGGDDKSPRYLMVVEIWDRMVGDVKTGIIGVKRWVKAPFTPSPTTRFFPYFALPVVEVDGQRHPQSLVTRARKIIDEYYRVASQESTHRKRIQPKIAFNAYQLDEENAKKIVKGTTGEYVPLKPKDQTAPLESLFREINYPTLNPALYSDERLINKLERLFGVQEALAGAIQAAKTATEAQIQQTGFNTRTSSRRDDMEDVLEELANYTAEVLLKALTHDDVIEIAGPDALWPDYQGPEDLRRLVRVTIDAGSSGKPDTAAERQAWATQLPILQAAIEKVGQLRNSDPADVADSIAELMRITAERTGDRRINIDDLLPAAGSAPPPQPAAAPGVPGVGPDGAPIPVTQPESVPEPVPQEV